MTLLLHPGFHKTATSWLQSTVFAEKRLFRSLMTHEEIDDLLVRPHDFWFDAEQASADISALRSDPKPGVVDVISSEILSGNILLGSRDSAQLAKRLAATCDEAKVLLTVRAQKPMARSIYQQYVKRGGRLGIEEFLRFAPEPGYFWFDPATLEFHKVAEAYAAYFGRENVMVLPQELLVSNRPQYLRLMFDFVGLEESVAEHELAKAPASSISPPLSGAPLLRIANSIGQSPFNPRSRSRIAPLGKLIERVGYRWTLGEAKAKQRADAALDAELSNRFGKSNAILQRFCPVDLKKLRYEMDD
ncbi:hypothetical protein NAP1_11488 [Erythrobacter sp. NAP1]|uniref:hypothetical protein n=1 Tax=Erythrobacter sp. NAP1 TaxID=237727 RepID=UPI00006878BC|nr:hypothetical protein [Erythrobacter sp. NAP1]EAQ28215.1 hypothetical protein NAP1_11488 [Erythrobacter sp. NAP1]